MKKFVKMDRIQDITNDVAAVEQTKVQVIANLKRVKTERLQELENTDNRNFFKSVNE